MKLIEWLHKSQSNCSSQYQSLLIQVQLDSILEWHDPSMTQRKSEEQIDKSELRYDSKIEFNEALTYDIWSEIDAAKAVFL